MNTLRDQIALEQNNAHVLYSRIDELIAQVTRQLESVIAEQGASTHQNRSERDSFAAFYEDRLALLTSVSHNALFGRLDREDATRHYIGRIGLFTADREQLLVDWRAPAAAAFYQATPRHSMGVRLRRHIMCKGRTITGIEDDVLDPRLLEDEDKGGVSLQGEGALLSAVSASRTGRMGDIVATIQAEQDRIIRHETRGVLVVQGGPGTGKTAVALHRAAYQLYTHRARLERSGVLIVAPTRGFLRYIERVLPSLGETSLVMATPGELIPGVEATAHDRPEVALVKGSLAMAKVLKRAIKHRQLVPSGTIALSIDGVHITLEPADVKAARREARATNRPHNHARTTFVRAALDILVDRYIAELKRLGHSYSEEDRRDLIADLRTHRDVKVALNRCWLPYTPESFLRSFLADPARVKKAAGHHLTKTEAALLVREKDHSWTVEDVPLLDEVAELLGDDDAAARQQLEREERHTRNSVEYASKVLDMIESTGTVSAEELAAHVNYRRDRRTLAERASGDRTWAYGHVVVDEAQELSPMMWRILMRRNPTKSFTVVGDVAQTSAPAGSRAWDEALAPFVEDRATIEELTVNYRTPTRIMTHALAVARAHDLAVTDVSSVREGDWAVRDVRADTEAELPATACRALAEALRDAPGRVALIAREDRVDALAQAVAAEFSEDRVGVGSVGVDREISVMGPTDAKGLEFDSTIVVEPRELVEAHERGIGDLYVAMTRPTQILALVHAKELPRGLEL